MNFYLTFLKYPNTNTTIQETTQSAIEMEPQAGQSNSLMPNEIKPQSDTINDK